MHTRGSPPDGFGVGRGLRVVIGSDHGPADGHEESGTVFRLAAGLAARGHDVHVVGIAAGSRAVTRRRDGVTVHGLPATVPVLGPRSAPRGLTALLRGLAPDVVHVWSQRVLGRCLARAASAQAIPLVVSDSSVGHGASRRERVLRRADLLTAPTPGATRRLADLGLRAPVRTVRPGVDLDRFRGGPGARSAEPSVLYVGTVRRSDHVDELLRAVALLPPAICAVVDVVGAGPDRARLRRLRDRLELGGRVRFHGTLRGDDLADAYRRCHAFCMPAAAEGDGTAVMQAMAAGRPVVAAGAVPLPTLVVPGTTGWLYTPGDVRDLAARLADVLCRATVRDRLGDAGRTVIASHGLERTTATFASVYAGAVEQRDRSAARSAAA